jgi:hypothetical protein
MWCSLVYDYVPVGLRWLEISIAHVDMCQAVKVPPSVDGKAVLDLPVSIPVSQTPVVPLANHS